MAKKKKAKVKSRRRRSVSGVSSSLLKTTAMSILGVAAAAVVSNQLKKLSEPKADGTAAAVNPKMLAAAQILAGVLIVPKYVPGAIGQGLSNGLVAVGSLSLLTELKVIKGIGAAESEMEFAVNGIEVLGNPGETNQTLIAGVE